MGRPVKFERDSILDATVARIARHGPQGATITGVAQDLGAPTGSLYHRFPSRDVLIGAAWLRSAESFQACFFPVLLDQATEDPVAAALHTGFEWMRAHPDHSSLLLLYRRDDLIGESWPPSLRAGAKRLERDADDALRTFTRSRFGRADGPNLRRARMALIDIPLAAVRRDLEARRVPSPGIEELTLRAAQAVLAPT